MRTNIQGNLPTGEHQAFRTTCGRQLQVGLLALGSAERPARRVSLDITAQGPRALGAA